MNYSKLVIPVSCIFGGSLLIVSGAWAQNKQASAVVGAGPVGNASPVAQVAPVAAFPVTPSPLPAISTQVVNNATPRPTPQSTPSSAVVSVGIATPSPEQPRAETSVAIVLPGVANEQAKENQQKSGIKGLMLIGPTCPAVQISVDGTVTNNDCGPDRYDGTASIYNASTNEVVAEVTANNGGNFKLDLEPGSYYAASPEGRLSMTWLPMTDIFTVNQGDYTDVTFMFDNGMR